MADQRNYQWRVTGKSVRGASHMRSGTPNQDASDCATISFEEGPFIVSVSDGHGSARFFRSQIGSRLAVKTAIEVLLGFMIDVGRVSKKAQRMKLISEALAEKLPQEIVRAWSERVDEHLKAHPFSTEELEQVEKRDGIAAVEKVHTNPPEVYGATLLTAVAAQDYVFFLQLGDGDIVVVEQSGEAYRALQEDRRLIANETTSLCEPEAWKNFRNRYQVIERQPPALILLSTDGYSNSFATDEDFLKVGPDILEALKTDGFNNVVGQLEDWLEHSSREGSGDDITLGLIYREDDEILDETGAENEMQAEDETQAEGEARLEEGEDEEEAADESTI